MSKYLGITIGPIIDTLDKANYPAGLWFVSAFFSHLSYSLCEKIRSDFQGGLEEILSPYFDDVDEDTTFISDGVGKYHDRIIAKMSDDLSKEDIASKTSKLIKEVKEKIIEDFEDWTDDTQKENIAPPASGTEIGPDDIKFLHDYLQIHFVVLNENEVLKSKDSATKENNNILLRISPYLDALELMQTTPSDDSHNIFSKLLFSYDNVEANTKILKTTLYNYVSKDKRQNILENQKKSIKSIGNIAAGRSKYAMRKKLKKYVYFAVVQADGDNMGKLLQKINTTEDIKMFSKTLLEYASEASKKVSEFGGMPIYAGGDDLLFLAPVENTVGKKIITIFDLCDQIDKLFTENINSLCKVKDIPAPSLSFGVSIQYYKYPLYEARQTAADLLFGVAKKHPNKNTMAIKLHKHSGQTIGLRMMMKDYQNVVTKFRQSFGDSNKNSDSDTYSLSSAIRTLQKNKRIMNVLENDTKEKLMAMEEAKVSDDGGKEHLKALYKDAWKNFQDNVEQEKNAGLFKALGEIYFDHFIVDEVKNEHEQDEKHEQEVREMEKRGEDIKKLVEDYCFKRNISSLGDYHEELNESMQGFISYLNIEKFLREKRQEGEFLPSEEEL